MRWCIEQHALPPLAVEPALVEGEPGGAARPGFVAARDVGAGEVVLTVPGDLAITSVDVGKAPQLAALAEGRSELVGLALWLMQERAKVRSVGQASDGARALLRWWSPSLPPSLYRCHAALALTGRLAVAMPPCPQGAASEWALFLQSLPPATLTPILWPDEERQQLLRGSPVLQVRVRVVQSCCLADLCGRAAVGLHVVFSASIRFIRPPASPLPPSAGGAHA